MADIRGQLVANGRIGIVVSQYHRSITEKLLEGALACCRTARVAPEAIDVVRVPGSFELGSATAALAARGGYGALVALGVVIRGETAHFDYIAGETTRALGSIAERYSIPVGFGLLTVDTIEQAVARAGGAVGHKGYEAAEAAIKTADAIRQIREAANPG